MHLFLAWLQLASSISSFFSFFLVFGWDLPGIKCVFLGLPTSFYYSLFLLFIQRSAGKKMKQATTRQSYQLLQFHPRASSGGPH